MILFTEILLVIITIFILFNLLKKKEVNFFSLIIIMYIALYIFPIVLYWILGVPDFGKHLGYNIAINDENTSIVYNLLVLVGLLMMNHYLKKQTSKLNLSNWEFKLPKFEPKSKFLILLVLSLVIILPLFAILFSPNPEIYLKTLGYFNTSVYAPSTDQILFHNGTRIIIMVSFISFLLLRLLSNNRILNLYIYFCMFFWVLLENKRTLFAFLLFAFAFLDTFKESPNTHKLFINFSKAISIILLYFLLYSVISGKQSASMDSFDAIRQYYFRDADLKLSIYWLLNPSDFSLLDYKGQSIIYNLLFFVPRQWWPTKPLPYDVYATSAALGHRYFVYYDWTVQVSWISEITANLGILGFLISIYCYILIDKKISNINNLILYAYSFYYILRMSMLGFGSNQLETVIFIILLIYFSIKNKSKNKLTSKMEIDYEYER